MRVLLDKLLEHGSAIDRKSPHGELTSAEVAYRVAELLPLSLTDKTAMLALADDRQLLLALQAALNRIFTQRSGNH